MFCTQCQTEKPDEAFPIRSARSKGRSSWCKECANARNRANYAANAEKHRARKRQYRKDNPEKISVLNASYRAAHREDLNLYCSLWAQRNKDKKNAVRAQRRAQAKQATPIWVRSKYLRLFYRLAKEEGERLGVSLHVDHIVPLIHPRVCGLHNEFNLQLVTARANLSKQNRYWPDM